MKTYVFCGLAWLMATAIAPSVSTAQEDKAALSKQAQEILKTNCYHCHGQDGTVEGGMNFILDVKTLIARKKVIPGNSTKSKLIQRIVLGEMPPEEEKQRPSDKELAILKQWIQSGAADSVVVPARKFISDESLVKTIQTDLQDQRETDCRFIRYFTITHLYNAGISEDQLQTYRNGLSKVLNSLSWGSKIVGLHPIDPAKTVFRIDLRDFKWNAAVWNTILAEYPYGIIFDSKIAENCSSMTGTKLPFVRGDWFVANATQPPLYHHILDIPATDRELEKLLKVDVDEDIKGERVLRAGFNSSGISRHNRLIERHETGYGAYWKSYDFSSSAGTRTFLTIPWGQGKGK